MAKYTSHVQLQYLMSKYKVNPHELQREIDQYYSNPAWDLVATPHGKVCAVQLKSGAVKPAAPRAPQRKVVLKPRVTHIKRKTLVRE